MAEQPMNWQETMLSRLADELDYPSTPDLIDRVRTRLQERPAPVGPRRLSWAPALAGVLGIALLVAGVVLTASSGVREAVADFLGLAVEGEEIHILPTPAPGVTPTPFPTPRPIESYATPTALGALAAKVGFEPNLPTGYASPKGTYVVDYLGVFVVVLEYERFDLWEANAGLFEKGLVFSKGVERLAELTINGRPAYWIAPGSHIVRFIGPDGKEVAGSERTVTRNTLVWRGATLNYRLETDLSKDEAVRLAESLP